MRAENSPFRPICSANLAESNEFPVSGERKRNGTEAKVAIVFNAMSPLVYPAARTATADRNRKPHGKYCLRMLPNVFIVSAKNSSRKVKNCAKWKFNANT